MPIPNAVGIEKGSFTAIPSLNWEHTAAADHTIGSFYMDCPT